MCKYCIVSYTSQFTSNLFTDFVSKVNDVSSQWVGVLLSVHVEQYIYFDDVMLHISQDCRTLTMRPFTEETQFCQS